MAQEAGREVGLMAISAAPILTAARTFFVSAFVWIALLWFGGMAVICAGLTVILGAGYAAIFAGGVLMFTGAFVRKGMTRG